MKKKLAIALAVFAFGVGLMIGHHGTMQSLSATAADVDCVLVKSFGAESLIDVHWIGGAPYPEGFVPYEVWGVEE